MPWEGVEEKKQKQGTNNARLAYVLHVHEQDYNQMKTLLTFAKAWKVWHKHWGNTAFTIEIPDERSSQAKKKMVHPDGTDAWFSTAQYGGGVRLPNYVRTYGSYIR